MVPTIHETIAPPQTDTLRDHSSFLPWLSLLMIPNPNPNPNPNRDPHAHRALFPPSPTPTRHRDRDVAPCPPVRPHLRPYRVGLLPRCPLSSLASLRLRDPSRPVLNGTPSVGTGRFRPTGLGAGLEWRDDVVRVFGVSGIQYVGNMAGEETEDAAVVARGGAARDRAAVVVDGGESVAGIRRVLLQISNPIRNRYMSNAWFIR